MLLRWLAEWQRVELYFRRFLNRERMVLSKLPDIKIDFAHDRKDDAVDLIFERYGQPHARDCRRILSRRRSGGYRHALRQRARLHFDVQRVGKSRGWRGVAP